MNKEQIICDQCGKEILFTFSDRKPFLVMDYPRIINTIGEKTSEDIVRRADFCSEGCAIDWIKAFWKKYTGKESIIPLKYTCDKCIVKCQLSQKDFGTNKHPDQCPYNDPANNCMWIKHKEEL